MRGPATRATLYKLHRDLATHIHEAIGGQKKARASLLGVAVRFLKANGVQARSAADRAKLVRLHQLLTGKLLDALENPPKGVLRASLVMEASRWLRHNNVDVSRPEEAVMEPTFPEIALPFTDPQESLQRT